MNNTRTKIILQAFNKLDRTGDGKVTVEDLKGSAMQSSHILNHIYATFLHAGVKE